MQWIPASAERLLAPRDRGAIDRFDEAWAALAATSPCDNRAADLLFNIVSRRHAVRSVVITQNLAFEQWGSVFGVASRLGALVDRFE